MNIRVALTTIMGLVMVFNGLYFTAMCIATTDFELTGDLASALTVLLAGLCIVLFLRNDLKNGVVASLMALGISMVCRYAYLLVKPSENIELITGDAHLIISVILIYYAASLIFHTSAGSTKALVCLGLLAATELVPTVYYVYMGNDFMDVVSDHRNQLIYCAMHIVILIILSRKEMLLESPTTRLERNSVYLYDEMCTPPNSYIDVNDVDNLRLYPEDCWTSPSYGPVLQERRVTLHGTDMEILLQRRSDDERVHISLSPKEDGSYTIPLSFPIEKIVLDGEDPHTSRMVRVYGTDGLFIDILINDYDKERKAYIETIRHRINKRRGKRS